VIGRAVLNEDEVLPLGALAPLAGQSK